MSILITLPDFDPSTKCISEWNKKLLIPVAERNNIIYHIIKGKNVSKKHVEYTIRNNKPRFLILNGHGTITGESICGQDNEEIIKLGVNDDLLESKIVHSFTCCSAKKLGKEAESEAFVGYDDLFIFWMHRSTTTRPLEDILAGSQMQSALTVPCEILKGKSVKSAYEASQKMFQKYIEDYLWDSDKHTTEEIQRVLPFLIWNKMHQKMFGNEEAKL
jgi:hypothetical protein